MGYTHYWTQKKDFSIATWRIISCDIGAIIAECEKNQIRFGNGMGKKGTYPVYSGTELYFNGIGDDAHESFHIYKKRLPPETWQDKTQRGWAFCKTARKPYDIAVVASLIYLHCFHNYTVGSDGDKTDWSDGLYLVRAALPTRAGFMLPETISAT